LQICAFIKHPYYENISADLEDTKKINKVFISGYLIRFCAKEDTVVYIAVA